MLSLLSDFKQELLTTILDEGTSKMPIKRVQLNQNLIGPFLLYSYNYRGNANHIGQSRICV